jgi:putative Holliday junction resolvase
MKLLGVDFGLKRVGLALAEARGRVVLPLATIERTTREALFGEILRLVREHAVDRIVVGLPLDLEGRQTLTTRQARNFAESLARRVDLPVDFADERLSSFEAEDRLREAGLHGEKLQGKLDGQAAALILENYLEHGAFDPDGLEESGA